MKFKKFFYLESAKQPVSLKAQIPLDDEVFILSKLFQQNGFGLKAVGGAVRDYLFHVNAKEKSQYKPKDIDLVTDANPKEVLSLLNTPEAKELNIQTIPVGEAFGVIMAQFAYRQKDGSVQYKKYEIATYREDIGGDGRRPDEVKFTSVEEDAKRRDLTMNALYYDIPIDNNAYGVITDYNGGQGFQDIKDKVARPIGDARQRFTEDNLRVMRLIRFFSRYSDEGPEAIEKADPATAEALREFSAMPNVSSERIVAEFLSGLSSAANPINYLKTLQHFNITERMFPGLTVEKRLQALNRAPQMARNPRIVLALLLHQNDPQSIGTVLRKMTYPVNQGQVETGEHKLVPHVQFLIKMKNFKNSQAYDLAKERNKIRPQAGQNNFDEEMATHYAQQHNAELKAWFMIMGLDQNLIQRFTAFQPSVKANDPSLAGLEGPALGQAIKDREIEKFSNIGKPNV